MRLHNQGAFEDIDVLRARTGRFLLKPVRGLSGKGIIILDIADGRFVADGKEVSSDELRAMVKEGKYLIQPFVTNQHPRSKAIFDKSRNTVRVTMVRTEKGVETLGCMFMTGASDSAYSNWHFGGICMYVDENGRLGKYGYSMSKKRITAHPDSGVVFEGFELPYFRETLRLCEQAMDLGFDGLIVESHHNPDSAWSDAKQQVTPDVLDYILSLLVIRDESVTTEGITQLRHQIDELDNQLMDLLAKRMRVCREIGQ